MLASQLGIRIILLVGGTVPLPASYAVTSALTRIEVTNDAEQGDGFQMTFTLSKDRIVDYGLLLDGTFNPFNRVIIGVLLGVTPEVLIDGIITHQQLQPSNEPGMSTLTVTGRDVSLMLDLEEKNEKYDNQPDFVIVMRLIAQYAQYGLIPQATPTTDVPIMLQRIPRQQETDLRFIQRMAERNGFVFYIEPLTFGVNTAYWGPENRLSLPQPALTMNMGPATNVESLSFSQDALAPVSTESSVVEPITKISIPIPSLPSLRIPPLVPSPTPARRTVLLRETANQNPAQAATASIAAATRSPDSVTGQGEVETVRYGSILRARKLVGVRGAGFTYNGNYYVRRVTHQIQRDRYTQSFTISREGTGALLPVVRP
ncbi:MAG TPA: hypothetical protein VFZ66_04100 [Herpetosiphonaceae bacterium]